MDDAEIDNLLDDFARGEVFSPPDARERFYALLHEGNTDRLNTDELLALYQWYVDLLRQPRTCRTCKETFTELDNLGTKLCLFHPGEFSSIQKTWSCCKSTGGIAGCRMCDHYETSRVAVVRVPAFCLPLFKRPPIICAAQEAPFLCMETDVDEHMKADELDFLIKKSVCVRRAEMY